MKKKSIFILLLIMTLTASVFMASCSKIGGKGKSSSGNKMNEIGPHRCWAEKIVMRAKAYGVIEDESKYTELFE